MTVVTQDVECAGLWADALYERLSKDLPDEALNALVARMRAHFGVAAAALTLVNGARLLFMAAEGFSCSEMAREGSFCERTLQLGQPLLLNEVESTVMLEEKPARFYAGVPVIVPDGLIVGTACLLHHSPDASFGAAQLAQLAEFASEASRLIQKKAGH